MNSAVLVGIANAWKVYYVHITVVKRPRPGAEHEHLFGITFYFTLEIYLSLCVFIFRCNKKVI